jgi:hypothetical protein
VRRGSAFGDTRAWISDEAASLARQCDEDIATIIAAWRPVHATRSATFFAGPSGSQSCS